MDGKIGLEEHFAIPETLDDSKGFLGDAVWPEPFENIDHAADWFDAAAIAEADRVKIGRSNALRLFKLSAAA